MQLRDIMRTRVVTIDPDETASSAWTRMRRRGIRHLVVTDGTDVVGIISERDLGGRDGSERRRNRTVRQLMTPHVASATPDTTVEEAADMLREKLIGSLPIIEDDRLAGIVTATDVFDALGESVGPLSRAERDLLRSPSSSRRLGGRPLRQPRREADSSEKRRQRANVDKRKPLADQVPRAVKRTAGRTTAPQTPANIRVTGVTLTPDERAHIRARLGAKLGKYARSIERVTVRVEDVNGPRGGVDQVCRIKVVLSRMPSVVVEHQAESMPAALNRALDAADRAVRKALERRKP